jgi:hypothetical protein
MEARAGVEPAYNGFAIRGITALLSRHRGETKEEMKNLERVTRLELVTSTLARSRSTN